MPGTRSKTALAWINSHPGRAFAAFLALHAALWTALPALLYPNLPLDLIEALMYGREWQLGYDKLPPLPWWLVQVAYQLVGHDFAYYLLAQIAVAAGLAVVFLTARALVGTTGALASVLIVDGLHYLNYTSAKFNHDVVQLPFWALAGFAFHRALRGRQNADWLLLGLAVGISLWAKYFVAVLAIPLALFVLLDREARQTLKTPGPYIALAAALVTMAPHLVWLVNNDFLPFTYAEHRALPSRGLIDHVWRPLQFAIGQLFFLLPSLLIAAPLLLPRSRAGAPALAASADAYDRRIVALLAFGPVATVLALSALSGRGTVAMWGYPLWLFLGLWIVLAARRALDGARLARLSAIWAVVFTGLGARLHRQLRGAAAIRSPLPRGVLSRRRYRARNLGPLLRGDRQAAGLRHRHHVGRRQYRALRAEPSAQSGRRQADARAVDRSQRPARARRGGGVDRRRSARHSAGISNRRRRRRGAATLPARRPARRQQDQCRLGDSLAAAGLCKCGLRRGLMSTPQMSAFGGKPDIPIRKRHVCF